MSATTVTIHLTSEEVKKIQEAGRLADEMHNTDIETLAIRKILALEGIALEIKQAIRNM